MTVTVKREISTHTLDDSVTPFPNTGPIFDQLHALVSPDNHKLSITAVQIRASALFAQLKAINREVNASVRDRKQLTTNARLEMDHMHLGLQNLQYEKRHLEREIEKCRQFAYVLFF